MTSDTVQAGLTTRNLLLGSGLEDDTAALRQALSEHNVLDAVGGKLSRLTGEGREAATTRLPGRRGPTRPGPRGCAHLRLAYPGAPG